MFVLPNTSVPLPPLLPPQPPPLQQPPQPPPLQQPPQLQPPLQPLLVEMEIRVISQTGLVTDGVTMKQTLLNVTMMVGIVVWTATKIIVKSVNV